jgi:hypothetical protein
MDILKSFYKSAQHIFRNVKSSADWKFAAMVIFAVALFASSVCGMEECESYNQYVPLSPTVVMIASFILLTLSVYLYNK